MRHTIRLPLLLFLGGLAVALSPLRWRQMQMLPVSRIGNFNLADDTGTVTDVPAELRRLDGWRITVTGYAYSQSVAFPAAVQIVDPRKMADHFAPPRVQDRVFATVVPGSPAAAGWASLDYTADLDFTGTFHVRIARDEGGGSTRSFVWTWTRSRCTGPPRRCRCG